MWMDVGHSIVSILFLSILVIGNPYWDDKDPDSGRSRGYQGTH
jgi:hypothetical protein